MSYNDLREVLTQTFINVMANDHPSATLTFDNIRYDQPRSGEWAHFSLSPDMHVRAELGPNPMFRNTGEVFIRVMGAEESGTSTLYSIVDSLLAGLTDKNLSVTDGSAHTYGGIINNRGIIEGWHTFEIRVMYKYDV